MAEWAPVKQMQALELTDATPHGIDIDDMSKDLSKMVLAAKNGTWNMVWELLQRNPMIINMIPSERAWSALHQAVYHNNEENVKKFIQFTGCDVFIRAKQDKAKAGELGITPRGLAEKMKSGKIAHILLQAETKQADREKNRKLITFRIQDSGNKDNPLFVMAITQYKDILLGNFKFNQKQMSLPHILQNVYQYQKINWQSTSEAIRENMAAFTVQHGTKSVLDTSTSASDFFSLVIQMYTAETKITYNSKPLYRHFNDNLRMEKCYENGSGMLLSPYIVLFEVALLFWDELAPYHQTTYRGIGLDTEDAFVYVANKGKTITWMSFTSSSKRKTVAESRARSETTENKICTLCIIQNDKCLSTYWSPKVVDPKSDYPEEEEAIYPAGAEFKINDTEYRNGRLTIHMELVGPVYSKTDPL